MGLYQKVWFQKFGVKWGKFGFLIPKSLRRSFGLVIDKEIDMVIDASGFAYGDQCGEQPTLDMASYVKTWKKRGVKVIFLPQAMGPFTSKNIRKAGAFIVENADLVFPRDKMSYKNVIDLVGERENVYQAPDFTNLVSGIVPTFPERFRGRFCLIPNYRMIEKTTANTSSQYPSFCAKCLKRLIELDHKPFILIHEGEKDVSLANQIVEEAGADIDIIREVDALAIKGILGLCSGVISSRYHGLVSALSQGVPALATSWSHKYKMLFEEYGLPDCCLSVAIEPDALNEQLERITNDYSRREIITQLNNASVIYKEQAEMMWYKVISVIKGKF